MTVKLKYDPEADRLRLALQPQGESLRVFWLCRNQCLSLLARLNGVLEKQGFAPKVLESVNAPPPRPKKDSAIDEVLPESLTGIRVQVRGKETRLIFVHPKLGVGLTLKAQGVQRLQEMLANQAERAGWDPAPGLSRLNALAAARAAIAQSKGGEAH